MYTESMIQKIDMLVTHIRLGTSFGESLTINLAWTKLLSGIKETILISSKDLNGLQQFHHETSMQLGMINA